MAQRVQLSSSERVFFEFTTNAGVSVDPVSPKVSFKDKNGTALVDSDTVTLTDVTLTKQSTGKFFYLLKPASGWSLEIIYAWAYGTIDSVLTEMDKPTEIEIIAAEGVPDTSLITSLFAVKEFLGIATSDKDAPLGALLKRVSKATDRYCGRIFKIAQYTEFQDGNGREGFVYVKNAPIVSLNSLYDDPDRVYSSTFLFATADYVTYDEVGRVELVNSGSSTLYPHGKPSFTRGNQNIKIIYTGGFSEATMPPDIELGVINWTAHRWQAIDKKLSRVDSVERGDVRTDYTGGEMPDEVKEMLDPYRLIEFGEWGLNDD